MPTGIGTGLLLSSIIGGGASIAGGALANKSKSTTTPTMDPAYGPLQRQILEMTRQRLQGSANLTGYQAGGTQQINHTFDTLHQAQDNNLTARGLSTSPVAGAVDAARENARGGQVAQFANSIPLLQRQLQAQDLGLAHDVLGLGRGQQTTGSSGGGAAGAMTNLAQYMGYLSGSGAFGRRTGPYGGAGTPGYPGDGVSMPNNPLGWG